MQTEITAKTGIAGYHVHFCGHIKVGVLANHRHSPLREIFPTLIHAGLSGLVVLKLAGFPAALLSAVVLLLRYHTHDGSALQPVMTQFCQTFQRLTSFIAVCSGLLLWPLAAHAENLSTPPLSWYERDQLSAEEQQELPEFCRGAYRIPAITPLPGDLSEAEAD